ncbi:unnamed protein product [Heligmosomoides polygyrus]|uniref:HTH_7 domain-containing protein n=1 Tax=Heligmosomoides polygyrus TaxID=6339 RepID=A0A183G7H0_HELPZ|nr:unnamed protein product [Heligmosomoides polygyrus]
MVDARLKRAQILALSKSGHTTSEIAEILKVDRSTVYRVIKRGTVQDLPRTGRPLSATTQQLKNTVRLRVTRNPARSVRKLAKDLHVSRTTMQRLIKNKLHLRPYKYKKKTGAQQPAEGVEEEKCIALLERVARDEHLSTVFSDEKLFTVERAYNHQNMRILAGSSKEADSIGRVVSRNTQPAPVMVWAGVSATGRTPLVFVEKGVKIHAKSYLEDILKKHLIPWAHSHYGEAE